MVPMSRESALPSARLSGKAAVLKLAMWDTWGDSKGGIRGGNQGQCARLVGLVTAGTSAPDEWSGAVMQLLQPGWTIAGNRRGGPVPARHVVQARWSAALPMMGMVAKLRSMQTPIPPSFSLKVGVLGRIKLLSNHVMLSKLRSMKVIPAHLVLVEVGVQQLLVGTVHDGGPVAGGKHGCRSAAPAGSAQTNNSNVCYFEWSGRKRFKSRSTHVAVKLLRGAKTAKQRATTVRHLPPGQSTSRPPEGPQRDGLGAQRNLLAVGRAAGVQPAAHTTAHAAQSVHCLCIQQLRRGCFMMACCCRPALFCPQAIASIPNGGRVLTPHR